LDLKPSPTCAGQYAAMMLMSCEESTESHAQLSLTVTDVGGGGGNLLLTRRPILASFKCKNSLCKIIAAVQNVTRATPEARRLSSTKLKQFSTDVAMIALSVR